MRAHAHAHAIQGNERAPLSLRQHKPAAVQLAAAASQAAHRPPCAAQLPRRKGQQTRAIAAAAVSAAPQATALLALAASSRLVAVSLVTATLVRLGVLPADTAGVLAKVRHRLPSMHWLHCSALDACHAMSMLMSTDHSWSV